MNRIQIKWKELKEKGEKAFIPFIMTGDPSWEITHRLIWEFEKIGVDFLELGVPFSDPIADGPVIQSSAQRALMQDITLKKILGFVKELRREGITLPLLLLSYYNPIYSLGIKEFVERAKEAGVDGVIIPDLPPEESEELLKEGDKREFYPIFLVAPTTSLSRLKKIKNFIRGFVYCVSVTGVTGIRDKLGTRLRERVEEIKSLLKTPVAVGFGISTPEMAKWVAEFADGVIVGSAIIKIIQEKENPAEIIENVKSFSLSLMKAMGKI